MNGERTDPNRPQPLSRDEQDLLSAFRESQEMPQDKQQRVWGAISGVGAGTVATASPAAAAAPWIVAATTVLVGAAVGISFVARQPVDLESRGRHDARDIHAQGQTPVNPAPKTREELLPPEVSPHVPPHVPPQEAHDEPAAAPVPKPKPKPKSKSKSASQGPSTPAEAGGNDLAREAALLARARKALADGDTKGALEALALHQSTYHRGGVLTPERQALEVLALCDDGQLDAAARKRRAFAVAHPGHALEARVRKACVVEPK